MRDHHIDIYLDIYLDIYIYIKRERQIYIYIVGSSTTHVPVFLDDVSLTPAASEGSAPSMASIRIRETDRWEAYPDTSCQGGICAHPVVHAFCMAEARREERTKRARMALQRRRQELSCMHAMVFVMAWETLRVCRMPVR
jgi:hypothetical protein